MKKAIFSTLLATFMIILMLSSAFPSANSLVLGDEPSHKLPLKGFVTPLQWGKPDLTVDVVTFGPSSPKEGERVTISAMIKNIGLMSAYNVKVGFYDGDPQLGGTPIGFVTISTIRARGSAIATTSWTAKAGARKIYVVADPDKTISESNEDNNVAYKTIVVESVKPNSPPVANAGGPYTGTEDVEVTFDGSGSYDPDGDPLTYHWGFGDGNTGTGKSPKHVYTAGGTYTVTLIVNDGKVDSAPAATTAIIEEVNDSPVAIAGPDQTVTDTDGDGIKPVTLNGKASYDLDGNIVSWEWREGETVLGIDPVITTSFNVAGSPHTVTLTVTDDGGLSSSDTCIITVTWAPVTDRWAVLIGISDYEGTENDLWNPHNDALDMNGTLVIKYGFPKENIKILLDGSATMDAILAAIDWLSGVEDSSDDIVVFFFSGHGHRVSEWDWSWRNADGDRESDGRDEFIVSHDLWAYADGFLARKFAAFDSDNLFLWFGSCYSGGMNDIYKASGFSGVICAACKENQYGLDVFEFDNTLFGEFYIDRGMAQGLADTDGDGVITAEEAFYYAAPLVATWARENTPYRSEPQIFDSDPANNFYL